MKQWNQFIETKLFYLLNLGILLPYYIHAPLLILALVYLLFTERDMIISESIKSKWLLIFIGYTLLNSLLQRNYLGVLVAFAFWGFFIIFLIYYQKIQWNSYLILLKVFVYSSIPLALLAIYNYLVYAIHHGYGIFYIFNYHNIQIRAESTFLNANYYGLFCIMVIIITLYIMLKEFKLSYQLFFYMLSLVFNGISIILTGSRAFIPLLVVLLIWFIIWAQRKLALPIILVSISVLVYLIIYPETLPRLTSIAGAFEDRFEIWQVAWNLFINNPIFGRGQMGYYDLYHLYTLKSDMHAHQLYLNILLNNGVLGTLLILILSLPLVKSLWRFFSDKNYHLEFALLSTMILLVILHGTIDVAIFWTQTAYVFLITILPLVKIAQKNL